MRAYDDVLIIHPLMGDKLIPSDSPEPQGGIKLDFPNTDAVRVATRQVATGRDIVEPQSPPRGRGCSFGSPSQLLSWRSRLRPELIFAQALRKFLLAR